MTTKAEIMSLIALGISHEIFHHTEKGLFDITVLRTIAHYFERCKTKFADCRLEGSKENAIEHLFSQRDIDKDRAYSLTAEQLDEPLIFVDFGDGRPLLVDGIHRMYRLYHSGAEFFRYYLVPADCACRVSEAELQARGAVEIDWGTPSFMKSNLPIATLLKRNK